MGRQKRQWTSEELKVLKQNKDKSSRELAKVLGISHSTIYLKQKELNLPRQPKARHPLTLVDLARELYEDHGLTLSEIARKLELSRTTVYQWIHYLSR